jgi:hypothetical protein
LRLIMTLMAVFSRQLAIMVQGPLGEISAQD